MNEVISDNWGLGQTLRHNHTMPGRPRRVPPPPPPGFGDDEYYRLYGQPEQYQKYRQVFPIILSISLEAPKIWIETVKQLLNFINIKCRVETGHLDTCCRISVTVISSLFLRDLICCIRSEFVNSVSFSVQYSILLW